MNSRIDDALIELFNEIIDELIKQKITGYSHLFVLDSFNVVIEFKEKLK